MDLLVHARAVSRNYFHPLVKCQAFRRARALHNILTVLSPGVAALCAAEELGSALVDAPGLNHPPVGDSVVALGAFDLGLG